MMSKNSLLILYYNYFLKTASRNNKVSRMITNNASIERV
jgi:hypothetical protein